MNVSRELVFYGSKARMKVGHAHPEKRRKVEEEEEDGDVVIDDSSRKNIVEIHGKSCLHEVAWPPGACVSFSLGGRDMQLLS